MFKRIIVIGSPGSGKSYFSKSFSKKSQLPLTHLDDMFWHEDWRPTPKEEWYQIILKLSKSNEYIIDGNYLETLDIRLKEADTVIFLDTPLIICLYRVLIRTIKNTITGESLPHRIKLANKTRKQKASENIAKFLLYVIKFRFKSRPKMYESINELDQKNKKIFIFKNRNEANNFLKEIGEKMI